MNLEKRLLKTIENYHELSDNIVRCGVVIDPKKKPEFYYEVGEGLYKTGFATMDANALALNKKLKELIKEKTAITKDE